MRLTKEEREFYDTEVKKRLNDKEEAERQHFLAGWPYTLTEEERREFGVDPSYKEIDPKDYIPYKRYYTDWNPLYFPYAKIEPFMFKNFTQEEIEEFDFAPYAHYHWYGFARHRYANPDKPVNPLWEAEHKKYSLEYTAKAVGIFFLELLDSLPYTLLITGTKSDEYDVPNIEDGTEFAWNWYYPINFKICQELVKDAMYMPPDDVFNLHFGGMFEQEWRLGDVPAEMKAEYHESKKKIKEFAYDIIRFGNAVGRKEIYRTLYEDAKAGDLRTSSFYITLSEKEKAAAITAKQDKDSATPILNVRLPHLKEAK